MLDLRSLATQRDYLPNNQVIAVTIDGDKFTWGDIQQRIDLLQIKLNVVSEPNIALFHTDAVEFLIGLLAVWRLGKTAVVPANTLDSMIDAVSLKSSIFLGELAASSSSQATITQTTHACAQSPALIIFTSGSTGTPTAVSKSFDQLSAELEMIEYHWGNIVEGSLVVGTVSHHHMYGLLFRLLWPLASGRVLLNRELEYLEQLAHASLDQQEVSLISSPSHLENFPVTLDWPSLNISLKTVFSAGSPLDLKAARRVSNELDIHLVEIYGSTETGALAYRNPLDQSCWQALCGVTIKDQEGRLLVRSPAVDRATWFLTDDLCTLVDSGRFKLNGRIDRILKVGGKRVSATVIERRLEEHPWVTEVKISALPSRKFRIGALLKLSAEGNAALVDTDKRSVCSTLTCFLDTHVDKVALPRYWRFVAKMPVNSQAKTTLVEIEALFNQSERSILPQIINDVSCSGLNHALNLYIPTDLKFFDGHFPGTPILPGVVQISWAIHYGGQIFGALGEFRRLEKLKFQNVIQPGDTLRLALVWNAENRTLTFNYNGETEVYASGRITFSSGDI